MNQLHMMKRFRESSQQLQSQINTLQLKIVEGQKQYEQLLRETKTQATQAQSTLLQTNQHQSQMLSMAWTQLRESRIRVRKMLESELSNNSARNCVNTTTPEEKAGGNKLDHIRPDIKNKMREVLQRTVSGVEQATVVMENLDKSINAGVEALKADKKSCTPQEREEFKAELQLLAAKRHLLTLEPVIKEKLGDRPAVLKLTDVD
jgi:hypothetical protein